MNSGKKPENTGIPGTVLIWATGWFFLVWLVGSLLERKWGAILIIWALWLFGAMIILGGAMTLITGDANFADQGWPWLLFGVAAAVMTTAQRKLEVK